MSVFGVFLVRMRMRKSECGKIRARKTSNTDTFYAVYVTKFKYIIHSHKNKYVSPLNK